MQDYFLMHKDIPCASLVIDPESERITGYHDIEKEYTPFLGHCDLAGINRWWKSRSVPASREIMKTIMREAGCSSPENYLKKNLALSMTDSYWICPVESPLQYRQVSFEKLAQKRGGIIPYHNETSYDPNASLGGQMDKYWDLSGDEPELVKESYRFYGQQSLNEEFATIFHKMQETEIPFVSYRTNRIEDGGMACRCRRFTSERLEFVPAYEILGSRKKRQDANYYQTYIDIVAEHGIDREEIQNFMDYQTMTDFLISNTDEHLMNFGMLRDSDTMELTAPAPIFDSGNSMFYSEKRTKPYTRREILERKITSFYSTEEKMMKNVTNPSVVDLKKIPSPEMVKEFYVGAGIPEEKAEFICANYQTKIQFVDELQHGKSVSLYLERQTSN